MHTVYLYINMRQETWNDLVSGQIADESSAPSAEGPQGLGDLRWIVRFRTPTWPMPGTKGFVGSKRKASPLKLQFD